MSCPDYIECEYPLPDPEAQNYVFVCAHLGCFMGAIYKITKDGRLGDGFDLEARLNFDGELRFFHYTKNGELYYYVAGFFAGQLYRIERADFIEFENQLEHPICGRGNLVCEHLGPNRGVTYRITESGRLLDPITKKDLYYHGDLKFYPVRDGGAPPNYVASFKFGQLIRIEETENTIVKFYSI